MTATTLQLQRQALWVNSVKIKDGELLTYGFVSDVVQELHLTFASKRISADLIAVESIHARVFLVIFEAEDGAEILLEAQIGVQMETRRIRGEPYETNSNAKTQSGWLATDS